MLKKYQNIFIAQIITWVISFNILSVIRFSGIAMVGIIWNIKFNVNQLSLLGINTGIGLVFGIMMSFADIFIMKTSRRRRLFLYHIIRKSAIYVITIILSGGLLSLIIIFGLHLSLSDFLDGFFSHFTFSYFFGAVVVSVISSFIGQVNQLLGPGKVWQLFLGRYYTPKEEFRFFLFIDLKSSTEHAEEMGRQRYSQFIQDFMFRVNLLLRKFDAEIYQYVGDEVVLTWTLEKGITNENAVQFFFALQNLIEQDIIYFQKKFGLIPEFKGGLNAGKVIVAEVGRVKKEIAYHGGTIITASRIQEQCNYYGVNLLAGDSIVELFPEPKTFRAEFVGEVRLKGKSRIKRIYTINEVIEGG